MKDRGFQSKKRYLISLIIASVVFILVFGITYSISYLEFQRVSNLQGEIAYSIFEDKLDYTLFGEGICSETSLDKISSDLGFQGRIIDDLEKKLGKNNEKVLMRKKFYTLIEVEHLEFVKELNKNCNSNINILLFFYSNEKEDAERSEEVGKMLDAVYSRNKKIIIYSFDINLDSELIEKLKSLYKIGDTTTVVINEKTNVEPQNINDIEKYLE